MKSAIYWGTVRHRRETPVLHHFNYKLFMVYLDLAEIDQVMDRLPFCSSKRPAPVRFKRRDYLGPVDLELDKAVKLRVLNETGHWPEGPVRMLTHLRYFGFCFNPVTFYYC